MKYLMTTLLLTASFGFINAQNIQITYTPTGNDVSNTTVNVSGGHMDNDIKAAFTVTNTSATDMDIKIKRYETSVQANTLNYFCWYVCYGTDTAGNFPVFPVPGSPQDVNHAVSVMAGQTSTNPFEAHHLPEGFVGTSCYRYVAYDGDNTNDSTYVDICYNIGFTSVGENIELNSAHYPNPANEQLTVEFESDLNPNTLQLSVYNALGEQIEIVRPTTNNVLISTDKYPTGVYFYTLLGEGIRTSKKFIVQH